MEYTFFWVSVAASLLLFAIAARLKGTGLPVWIIGIATVAYSMAYEILLGDRLGLYYYIAPEESTLYILLSALFIYAPLNMVYAVFLPEGYKKILIYTLVWIAAMLVFEYVSFITRSVVLTGWRPVPWSIVTYAVTYIWIIPLYRYTARLPRRRRSLQ